MFRDVLSRIEGLVSVYGRIEVFGIPTSGLPYAEKVAQIIGKRLKIVPVVKLRMPSLPFISLGALSTDRLVLNNDAIAMLRIESQVEALVAEARIRLEEVLSRAPMPTVGTSHRIDTAIIVDDAVATGFTIRCAAEWVASRYHPAHLVLACDAIDEAAEAALAVSGRTVIYGGKFPAHAMQQRRTSGTRIRL